MNNQNETSFVPQYSFEQAIDELEGIISHLESGEMPLERALEVFRRGVSLVAHCNAKLEEAQGVVKLLTQNQQGGIREVDFEFSETDEGNYGL